MTSWLKCMVSPGPFPVEYTILGRLFDGSSFSLYSPINYVRVDENQLKTEDAVDGWLKVRRGQKNGGNVVISLPQPTFQYGRTVSVSESDLKDDDPI